MKISRALLSVHDKKGIVELAKALARQHIEMVSTGGTAQALKRAGIPVTDISQVTKFPEMLDGRIKTLHPRIHAAVLADRRNAKHMQELKRQDILPIDLVVVNLYPFEETAGKKHTPTEATEQIDIGGPALLRAAAKNHENVAVVCNPAQYDSIVRELLEGKAISEKTRQRLALEAWEHVAHYDVVIENYFRRRFGKDDFPKHLNQSWEKIRNLRYGENRHQQGALYRDPGFVSESVVTARLLKEGKKLSYNNILDGNAAIELIKEFEEPTAAVIKHNNPSGVASDAKILEAYKQARSVDPEAAFGGIVAVNREVDGGVAREILHTFVEVVIAPRFTPEAMKVFEGRKNLRLLELPGIGKKRKAYREYRSVVGGLLVQDANTQLLADGLKVVTQRKPTDKERAAMLYAWKIVKYVKSNAIVFAKENRAIGIGAGQMKRVDAAKLAATIARDYSGPDSLKGCAMASDAFFPFRDGIDFAAKLGVTAIIQPGGSIKDKEVIAAADEHGIAMVFTGTRHFRH